MPTKRSPPGRFSTITGSSHVRDNRSATSRDAMSAPLPGPNGTINLTVRWGQFCCPRALLRVPSTPNGASVVKRSSERRSIVAPSNYVSWKSACEDVMPRRPATASSILCYPYLRFSWGGSMDERILRRLKLSDLRLFRTVVDSGGMAKAASNLNISQSAVSKAITALEQALRVRLLDRTPSGVAPTPYGEALLRRAHAIFDELQQSINEIEYLSDPNMGELRFGATEPLMDNFVPAIIDRLLRSYSRMRFRVSHLHSVEYQQRELRERNVELVVSRINASEMA